MRTACTVTEKGAATTRKRECERCWRSKERRLESVLTRAPITTNAALGKQELQTDLYSSLIVFFEAKENPQTRGDGSLNGLKLLRPSCKDLSHVDTAKSAVRGCGGTSYFLDESRNLFVEFSVAAAEVPQLVEAETSAKISEVGAELFAESGLLKRDGHDVHQRQKDLLVRHLFTKAYKSLIELFGTGEASAESGYMKRLRIFYVLEQPVLVSIPGEPSDDDGEGVGYSTVMNEKAAAADGGDHAVRRIEKFFG